MESDRKTAERLRAVVNALAVFLVLWAAARLGPAIATGLSRPVVVLAALCTVESALLFAWLAVERLERSGTELTVGGFRSDAGRVGRAIVALAVVGGLLVVSVPGR